MSESTSALWAVTGAAGYLRSHVVDTLLARGTPVLAVDDFSVGRREFLAAHRENPLFHLVEADVRDAAGMSSLFKMYHCASVVHLAAIHYIPACNVDPPRAVSLNVHRSQSVLTAARVAKVERFWLASSGDVYGASDTPHREEDQPAPFAVYGLTKWLGEQLVGLESQQRPEARFVVGRLFNLYGPRETNPYFLPECLASSGPTLRQHFGSAVSGQSVTWFPLLTPPGHWSIPWMPPRSG